MHSRFRLLTVGGLVALVATLALSQTVFAHSRPVRFDPAPGAVLSAAPARVQGWFSSDMRRADSTFIQVFDAQRNRVDSGDVQLASDRRSMSVGLRAGLGEGRYLVYYSALDDGDGHAGAGCYAFFVGQAAADAAASGGDPLDGGSVCPALAEPEEEEEIATESGGGGVPLWGLLAGIVVGVVVGGVGGRYLGGRT